MARNVRVSDMFAGLITGHVGHRVCFFKTIATAPYWLFSEKLEPGEPLDLREPGLPAPGARTA